MKLQIITEGNPLLRNKSETIPVEIISTLKVFVQNLAQTMYEDDGIGIAAPQVGKNIRLIIIGTKNGPMALFNPKITKKSWRQEWGEEGCLSVPGVFGDVKRSKSIQATYLDKKGKVQKLSAEGLFARVIQHEVDHLNGILFIDKARNISKNSTHKNQL